jgi:phage recombination protein Bet
MTEIQKYEVTDELLAEYLKFYGVSKLTEPERIMFIQVAKGAGLNPFKREIHLIKYNEEFAVVTGYEVYIKRAEATGLLGGWKCWTEGEAKPIQKQVERSGKNGKYTKTITVWEGNLKACIQIIRKDWKEPFYWEVYLSEYVKDNEFWNKPITMIKKVVTGQGFRLGFSDACKDLPYTVEEAQAGFTAATVISSEPLEKQVKTVLQTLALELCNTSVFSDPASYQKTEVEIMKDTDEVRINKIITYLKGKQPPVAEAPTQQPEPEVKQEPEQLQLSKEEELMQKIDQGEDVPAKQPEQELTKEEEIDLFKIPSNKEI